MDQTLSILGSKPALTIADLITGIAQDSTLRPGRRKVCAAHMSMVVRIVARCTHKGVLTASAIPCDVPWLNDRLFRLPARAHNLEKGSFAGVVSSLRVRLRLVGLLDPATRAALPDGSAWGGMLESIKDKHCRYGLMKFVTWCDGCGITPVEVDDGTLAAFEAHVRTRHLQADIPGFISNVAKSWRKAASLIPNWPSNALKGPLRLERYTKPFSFFSVSLQEDIARLEQRLSGSATRGPFRAEGAPRPLRPRSVTTRLYSIRQALTALVASGYDPAEITGLHQLVTPEAMETILLFYWRRAVAAQVARGALDPGVEPAPEDGITSQTGAIGDALMIVARHHVRLPEPELRELAKLAASVRRPTASSISPHNRALLDELCEPVKRMRLLRLPATLRAMADRMPEQPLQAALLAMTSIAIEIELNKPLRLANLTELKLGENLQFTDPRSGRPTLLKIPAWQVKNAFNIEWPLSPELGERIRHYLVRHRPHLGPAESSWLFPAQSSCERPRSAATLRDHITAAVEEHVGVRMHVHLFRAFGGVLLLEANPGGLEDLRLLLDHKTLQTSLAYYAYRQPAEVARRVDRALKRARSGLSPEEHPAPAVRRKRRGSGA